MDLDIRLPIGLMFLLLGPMLSLYGLAHQIPMDQAVGLLMTVFGLVMGYFGRSRGRGQRDA